MGSPSAFVTTAVQVTVTSPKKRSPGPAVIRIDPTDARVAQTLTEVCDEPGGIAAVAGAAWLACRLDGTVLRIGSTGVDVTAPIGFVPNDVALDGENVWVTLSAE